MKAKKKINYLRTNEKIQYMMKLNEINDEHRELVIVMMSM